MSNEKRPKASDLYKGSVLGRPAPFSEVFPTVERMTFEVEQDGKGVYSFSKKRFYSETDFGEYINCSNPLCVGGGFEAADIVREMVRTRQTHLETEKYCMGYEGSPKGRVRYGGCYNTFKVRVSIKYRPELSDETSSPSSK